MNFFSFGLDPPLSIPYSYGMVMIGLILGVV
jgi:hypothetical protein